MKYTSKNPNGINQITGSAVAITVLNNDVAVFTTSSLNLSGSLTASSALITGNVTVLGTASINTLVVNQTQLSTGSNQLGDAANDTQTLYGTVVIPTGSFNVTGSSIMSGSLNVTGGITGSLFGTASYIPNLNEVTTAGNTTTNAINTGLITTTTSAVGNMFAVSGANSTSLIVSNDSAGRASITVVGNQVGSIYTGGAYFTADGYQESWFGVTARSASSGNKVWRFGNSGTSQYFSIQKLNDAGSAVTLTALTIPSSTGNILINSTTDAGFKLDVNGTARVSGNVQITGSATNSLRVKGSGTTSATTSLRIENSSASPSLIIRDDQTIILTGAVQTTGSISISGSLLIGENSSSLYTSRTTIINSGSTDLYSIPTSSYDAVYFDYVIKSGSNARAGQVFSTYITTASTYIDNSTSDIGNTSVFYFSSSISSSNLVLHGSTTSDGWKVKTIIRGL